MTSAQHPPGGVPLTVPATRAHVLVCTGPQCSVRGSRQLFRSAWAAFEDERIAYYRTGGSVRLTEAGCLGACDHGPNIAIYETTAPGTCRESWLGCVDLDVVMAAGRRLNRGHPTD